MKKILAFVTVCAVVCWSLAAPPSAAASENPVTFAFVDAGCIITAESAGAHAFVVNFINLSDYVLVVQPADFIYRSASGQHYIGQVYKVKHQDPLGKTQTYTASVMLKGHSFTGLNILGCFREKESIEEMSVRIGSRRFYMQALEKIQFDELVRKIEGVDLDRPDVNAMYGELNLDEMGTVESTDGTDAWDRDWEGLIADGINPPRAIEHPPVPLPEDASGYDQGRTVRLSGLITKNGGVRHLKVVKGINRKLEERALDAVANTWQFLPATKNGEVYESLMEFDVPFVAPFQIP